MFESLRNTRNLSAMGIVAALYVALTFVIAPIAYGPIQLRLSEILVLLAFINPLYGYAATLGVLIANLLLSPYPLIDGIVGTSSTLLAVILISKTNNLLIASLWPTITAALFVGPMLHVLYGVPLLFSIVYVGIGQFIVLTCIGYPVFKYIINNKTLYNIIKL